MRRALMMLVAALPLLMAAKCERGAAITCPALKPYSREFQAAAEAEYAAVEKTAPHLVQMIDDYGVSRAVVRACLKRRDR